MLIESNLIFCLNIFLKMGLFFKKIEYYYEGDD